MDWTGSHVFPSVFYCWRDLGAASVDLQRFSPTLFQLIRQNTTQCVFSVCVCVCACLRACVVAQQSCWCCKSSKMAYNVCKCPSDIFTVCRSDSFLLSATFTLAESACWKASGGKFLKTDKSRSVSVHVCEDIWVCVNRKDRICVCVWACSMTSLMMSLHLWKASVFSVPDLQLSQIITGENTPALTVNSFISQLDQTGFRVSTDDAQCNKGIDFGRRGRTLTWSEANGLRRWCIQPILLQRIRDNSCQSSRWRWSITKEGTRLYHSDFSPSVLIPNRLSPVSGEGVQGLTWSTVELPVWLTGQKWVNITDSRNS